MPTQRFRALLLLLVMPFPLLSLAGCDSGGPGEFDRMITGIAGGGGGAASRAVPQQAPANLPATAGTLAVVREQHGAVTPGDCDQIAERMRKRGFRLVGVRPNNLGSGGVLNYICDFESNSADEGDGRIYENQY
jgi:hypothetical protein